MLDVITQRLTVAEFLKGLEPTYSDLSGFIQSEIEIDDIDEATFIRKGFEVSAADLELVPGERAEISKISTLSLDRDREVLLPEGADLRFFRDNPVVPYAHDYYGLPVGESVWVKIDSKEAPTALLGKTRYVSKEANPMAEHVWLLHVEKVLRAKSVGFIPVKWKKPSDEDWVEAVSAWRSRREVMLGGKSREADPERIYTKWVLLEYSPVPIPANQDALMLAISKGVVLEEQARQLGLIDEEEPPADLDDIREFIREELGKMTTEFRTMLTDFMNERPDPKPDELSDDDVQKLLGMTAALIDAKTEKITEKPTIDDIIDFELFGTPI